MKNFLVVSDEVQQAQEVGTPIVALESTIISHGMPYPQNVETALAVEAIIRQEGCVPATIAIIDGQLKVGLTEQELQYFGRAGSVVKASTRDIGYLIATKQTGATTVAATMLIAKLANIQIFVTGGIGGVHRGAEQTMDISADLEQLASTDVAVVCAGAKSILNIALTMEYLETKAVPVIGYKTTTLPTFYSNESAITLAMRSNTVEEIAGMLQAHWALGLKGVVIANPIPTKDALSQQLVDGWINGALQQAEDENITGKDVTPYVLAQIKALSNGASLAANIALIRHNAKVGAQLARALQDIKRS